MPGPIDQTPALEAEGSVAIRMRERAASVALSSPSFESEFADENGNFKHDRKNEEWQPRLSYVEINYPIKQVTRPLLYNYSVSLTGSARDNFSEEDWASLTWWRDSINLRVWGWLYNVPDPFPRASNRFLRSTLESGQLHDDVKKPSEPATRKRKLLPLSTKLVAIERRKTETGAVAQEHLITTATLSQIGVVCGYEFDPDRKDTNGEWFRCLGDLCYLPDGPRLRIPTSTIEPGSTSEDICFFFFDGRRAIEPASPPTRANSES